MYDDKGNERGGLGIADIEGSAAMLAQEHPNVQAIGWRVSPDGAASRLAALSARTVRNFV
jgi:hypothetical protein